MTRLHAVDYDNGKALFEVNGQFVVVDTNKRDVEQVTDARQAVVASAWLKVSPTLEYPGVWRELAEASVTTLEVTEKPVAKAERRFAVPAAVKEEARQALDWATSFDRGRSNVGETLARKLVEQTYVTLSDVQRMHRYFNRMPSPTEAAGWAPGQPGFPVDDRIRYGLRGGHAAREWVAKISKKHPLTAALPNPDDTGEVDGNAPHQFTPDPTDPMICEICGRVADDAVHTTEPDADEIGGPSDADVDDGAGVDQLGGEEDDVADSPESDIDGFVIDPNCDYFGLGVDPDNTNSTALYKHDNTDDSWAEYDNGSWLDMEQPGDTDLLIMLDDASAKALAQWIDTTPPDQRASGLELSMLNPHEAALFALAYAEMDWTLVDRVFDIYDSQERSVNAKKQVRAPGGRFGSNPDSKSNTEGVPKARLPQALPLVPDVNALIEQYLSSNTDSGIVSPDAGGTPVPVQASADVIDPDFLNRLIDAQQFADAAPADPNAAPAAAPAQQAQPTGPRPLYLAIVDKTDTQAVMDLLALMPGQQPTLWKRDNGRWVQAPELLSQLRGATPPPVVELNDDSTVANVIEQVDKATAGTQQDDTPSPGTTPMNPDGSPANAPAPDANPDQHPVTAAGSHPCECRGCDEFDCGEDACACCWVYNDDGVLVRDTFATDLNKKKRDKYAKKGVALPDGSFPIPDVAHLKKAIKAVGRAKNQAAARKHIMKRARALGRVDLVPDDWKKGSNTAQEFAMWGPYGELMNLTAAAGKEVTPEDFKNTERLRQYWTHGEGAAKIGWSPGTGSWRRCVSLLSKYLGTRARGYCTLRMHDALGIWPGSEENNPERDVKDAIE